MRQVYRTVRQSGLLGLAVALLVAGCKGGGPEEKVVPVSGKLTQKGAPYKVLISQGNLPPGAPPGTEPGRVQVIFYPVKSESDAIFHEERGLLATNTYPATVGDDGSFTVPGAKGKGIPPGKYRIVIKHMDVSGEKDQLKGKFDELNSKINRDVTEGGGEIVLDVSKPTG